MNDVTVTTASVMAELTVPQRRSFRFRQETAVNGSILLFITAY